MLFAEFLALLGILGAAGLGVGAIVSQSRRAAFLDFEQRRREKVQHDDLRVALQSRDYRQLDDWLALYGDRCDPVVRQHVEQRRTDLYIEKNP